MQEKEESMEAYTSTSLRIGNTRERERALKAKFKVGICKNEVIS
jgi:hypothetical protein